MWMAFVPMGMCVMMALDQALTHHAGRWLKASVIAIALLAAAIGLPARLAVTLREWHLRDYAPVQDVIRQQVRGNDSVYCAFQAYYPAKAAADVVFLEPYASRLTDEEKA